MRRSYALLIRVLFSLWERNTVNTVLRSFGGSLYFQVIMSCPDHAERIDVSHVKAELDTLRSWMMPVVLLPSGKAMQVASLFRLRVSSTYLACVYHDKLGIVFHDSTSRIRHSNRYGRVFLSTAQRASINVESQLVRCGPCLGCKFFQVWGIGIGGFHDSVCTPDVGLLNEEPLLLRAKGCHETASPLDM